ncbi:methyltransferase domain-containing protein [Duganella sp. FT94W]|uniref:Methyltransferase domain-containing protein n=1 Tax=Duganella lactea TaxID=2692173 RepID=A0ABW9VC63_9BURK|nr:class I SAM-dependent methyltransferase [Duganella lactea]MYM37219.1 methyltransferase domain-containing protein [Duganella lactea]
MTNCIVCGNFTTRGLAPWHAICPVCRYESAALAPTINDAQAHERLNEADREAGLRAIRAENFRAIADAARAHARPGARTLLDVGCAHGWFLEQAGRHFEVLGMEPDQAVAARTGARGLAVRCGYFPDALRLDELFDVIVFNDVIEHIPDIGGALAACHARLRDDGLLVLNLPNSGGLFYRLAKLLTHCGWRQPFERLWQKGLPSPHVHYFNSANLTALLRRHGFRLQLRRELPAVRASGLLARLRCTGDSGALVQYASYAAVLCMLPLLRLFPSDIVVCLFRKE